MNHARFLWTALSVALVGCQAGEAPSGTPGASEGSGTGIPAGPQVGKAWKYLKELRLERGPLEHDEAVAELKTWWNAQQP